MSALSNDLALVTGASRNIGHAIALALGGAGARVVGTSTSAEGAAALTETFKSKGIQGRGAVLATNLTSVFRLSKACVKKMMKDRRGRIVNITSIVGLTGNPGQVNYSAAKAGMLGFTKSLAREVASRNITVNAVAPGFIDTDMTRVLNADQRAALQAQIPLGRLGSADDIAAAVLFLVSPGGSYITGETLHVNGGMYMP